MQIKLVSKVKKLITQCTSTTCLKEIREITPSPAVFGKGRKMYNTYLQFSVFKMSQTLFLKCKNMC